MTHQALDEVYFSVDIEADGPIPGPYSMSSLGIALVARRTPDGDIQDLRDLNQGLYLELKPISDDYVPAAAAVAGLDREKLARDGMDPVAAMAALNDWVLARSEGARSVFTAWPLSYDWMWVYWYLMNFHGSSPFGHSSAIDMKTWFAARDDRMIRKTGKRGLPRELKSRRKHTHNALDDAWEQADILHGLLNWRRPAEEK